MKKLISIAFALAVMALVLSLITLVLTLWAASYKHEISFEADGDIVTAATDSPDPSTTLVVDDELPLIIQNCTACHSAKLIEQNRATREGWKSMIVWMQETQNLWDLGTNEDKILDYLARHYAPEKSGRRKNLENIVWYDLKKGAQED